MNYKREFYEKVTWVLGITKEDIIELMSAKSIANPGEACDPGDFIHREVTEPTAKHQLRIEYRGRKSGYIMTYSLMETDRFLHFEWGAENTTEICLSLLSVMAYSQGDITYDLPDTCRMYWAEKVRSREGGTSILTGKA